MDFLTQFLHNKIVIVAVLSWAIAQAIKIITDIIKTKKIDLELLFSTGGMPTVFAVSLVLAIVVMYDAAGVRRQAGKQAAALNKIIENIGFKIDERFKELLGHTPVEVAAGALLGTVVAVVANCLF
jgi:hypothetical protein